MITFKVTINGAVPIRIGVPDEGVTTIVLTRVKRKASDLDQTSEPFVEEMDISLGGLQVTAAGNKEHLKWLKQNLVVGDQLSIKVEESNSCDAPQNGVSPESLH